METQTKTKDRPTTTPIKPSQPSQPSQPGKPNKPGKPSKPSKPSKSRFNPEVVNFCRATETQDRWELANELSTVEELVQGAMRRMTTNPSLDSEVTAKDFRDYYVDMSIDIDLMSDYE